MTDEEEKLMKEYGITVEVHSEYLYMGYKYRSLKDALNYAKLQAGLPKKPVSPN